MTKQSYALWSKNPCIDFKYEDCTKKAKEIELPLVKCAIKIKKSGFWKIIGYERQSICNYKRDDVNKASKNYVCRY